MASQAGTFNVQEFADVGTPLVGGRLYTYVYGTTTQKTAYTDAAGTVPHTYTNDGLGGQYIALNSRGELPAPLYLDTGSYDLALKRADGSTVWTRRANGQGSSDLFQTPKMYPWLAKGDGVTDDTVAINAFLAAVTRGHFPAGTYKITGKLTFSSNQVITGDGPAAIIKYAASSPPANDPVLKLANISNTNVSGLTLQVPASTYTTARSIYIDTCTNCHVTDILFSGGAGGNAAYLTAATRCSVARCYVDDYRSNGFYVTGGYGNVIDDNDIPDGSGGLMGVQLVGGEANTASRNRIAKIPDNYFGIHAYGGFFPVITQNSIKNTRREAIALGGAQTGGRVVNNTMYWDTALGTGDFGMSVAGDDGSNVVTEFLIAENTIIQSALDGIGIAGYCQRGRVMNNVIRDCAWANAAGHQAGIAMYGWIAGAFVQDMVVSENTIAKLTSPGLLYAVMETPSLGSVSNNAIKGNKGYGLSATPYPISSALLVLNSSDLNLNTYSAAPTSSAGSLTTAGATLNYQRVGKFVLCRLTITITTNGTGATSLLLAIPFSAASGQLTGAETSVTGKSVKAGVSGGGTQLTITNYDNTYPGANGVIMTLTGILELA